MIDNKFIYVNIESQTEIALKRMVDKIISSGRISPQDRTLLIDTLFQRNDISESKRCYINRIFDHIQTGQLKLVEWSWKYC